MLTTEQLDNWFSYHAPTDETAPRYVAIRDAERNVIVNITHTSYEVGSNVKAIYDEVNASTRHFAEVIDTNAPDCADKTAAIRCVRIARNLFNEWATQRALPYEQQTWKNVSLFFVHAEIELVKARMQANSAIACGGSSVPLRSYRCPSNHVTDELIRGDYPQTVQCSVCRAEATYTLGAPATGRVIGTENPGGTRRAPARDGFATTEETATVVIREKGTGLVVRDWRCENGHTFTDVYNGDEIPKPPACLTCGAPTKQQIGTPLVDWWTAEGFDQTGGYYCHGLGTWIRSKEHRQQIMDERGLVEGGDDSGRALLLARKQAEWEAEDREVLRMIRECDADPETQKARDHGLVPDWSWARQDLEAKYGRG